MARLESDAVFAGSLPDLYDTYLVPLIFLPYATDLSLRVAADPPASVLEVAAGTGAVTRALAGTLPAGTRIVATDRNQPMLDRAAAQGASQPVEWRQADAQALPFEDASFDAVVCQFGVMFFSDRVKAFAEARRVLRPGGRLLFNTWDRIEQNDFANEVTQALVPIFPDDPPRFLERTPHGYWNAGEVAADVVAGGFETPLIETVAARSRAASARVPAIGYCQGTPLRNEIEARNAGRLAEATEAAARALAARFGAGAVEGRIQAHIVTATVAGQP
jgi:SAM-dependent methyltransferase